MRKDSLTRRTNSSVLSSGAAAVSVRLLSLSLGSIAPRRHRAAALSGSEVSGGDRLAGATSFALRSRADGSAEAPAFVAI